MIPAERRTLTPPLPPTARERKRRRRGMPASRAARRNPAQSPTRRTSGLARALDGKKGGDIKVLKTEGLTTLADYFVLCTATSNTQIKAMSDACEEAAESNGERAHHIEGHRGGTWLLMDFSSVVVHVFTDEARKFYDLERLWSDAEELDMAQVLGRE